MVESRLRRDAMAESSKRQKIRQLLFIFQIIFLVAFFALFNMHESNVAQLNHKILFLRLGAEKFNLANDQDARVRVLIRDIKEVTDSSEETKQSQILLYGLFILMAFSVVVYRKIASDQESGR
jgi:hypothetical protein